MDCVPPYIDFQLHKHTSLHRKLEAILHLILQRSKDYYPGHYQLISVVGREVFFFFLTRIEILECAVKILRDIPKNSFPDVDNEILLAKKAADDAIQSESLLSETNKKLIEENSMLKSSVEKYKDDSMR